MWLDRLDAEIHNFRTAFEWLMGAARTSTARATMALDLATDLWRFWVARGRLREGRSWLNRALDRPESASIELASRAKATQYLGNMALDQGDLGEAGRRYSAVWSFAPKSMTAPASPAPTTDLVWSPTIAGTTPNPGFVTKPR